MYLCICQQSYNTDLFKGHELASPVGAYIFQHMKNKGMQQSDALPENSEAIDVWKNACHPPSRHVVAYDYYPI